MKEAIEALAALPAPTMCRLIDFESAMVIPGINPNVENYFLILYGKKPMASMTVQITPLIYIQEPDYWGIEVVGCQQGPGIPAEVPYSATFDITSFLGKRGIEVIGAKKKQQIKVMRDRHGA